ncbi:MAG: hypothetical protein Q4D38_00100 [Planctomycetia bacterium]|nr:hypothetical protein [Planctomycetia bacterium]
MFVLNRRIVELSDTAEGSKTGILPVPSASRSSLYDIQVSHTTACTSDPKLTVYAFSNLRAAHEFVTTAIDPAIPWNTKALGDPQWPIAYTTGYPGAFCITGRPCLWDQDRLPWPIPFSIRESGAGLTEFKEAPYEITASEKGHYSTAQTTIYVVLHYKNGSAVTDTHAYVTTVMNNRSE